MRFVLLGTVSAIADGRTVEISRAQRRAVLAYLLLNANQTVSASQLVDALWSDGGPSTARTQIFASISAVRRALRAAGADPIDSQAGGYRLNLAIDELDVAQFRDRVDRSAANARQGHMRTAAHELRSALQLWQGEPLAGVNAAFVESARVNLTEQRLRAHEQLFEYELALGRHRDVIGDLMDTVAANPFHERFTGQLMLALHRSGQQAEALATYRRIRRALAEDLGIDPGVELEALHHRMLTGDRTLLGPPAPPVKVSAVASRFLPRDVPDFVGRETELTKLDALTAAQAHSEIMLITAVQGAGGIGKTALAVRWAHQVVDHFPDGQLYVNLRGFDQDAPISPFAALVHLLRCLGVAADKLPTDLESASATYRSLLSGKRTLVLLDNARSADQVRPLLPGHSACVVIVTSRNRLSGLIAVDGAQRLTVDGLGPDTAVTLLARIVGEDRVARETEAVSRLVALCGGFPAALRIAAAQLADRPHDAIGAYVDELTSCDRLAALSLVGDEYRALRAVLGHSYEALSRNQQRAFRLLGLFPGPGLSTAAASALLNVSPSAALAALDELASAHLLQSAGDGRYMFHDLIRDYARHALAQEMDSVEEPLQRLYDHYQRAASEAHACLDPNSFREAGQSVSRWSPRDAMRWLDFERANLSAIILSAAAHGFTVQARAVARPLFWFLFYAGYTGDSIATFQTIHSAVSHSHDEALKYSTLDMLGASYVRSGDYGRAMRAHQECIAGWTRMGDDISTAKSRANLAMSFSRLARYPEAIAELTAALEVYQRQSDAAMEAQLLGYNIPLVLAAMGRYPEAVEHIHQAIEILEAHDNKFAMARTLQALGETASTWAHPTRPSPIWSGPSHSLAVRGTVASRRSSGVISAACTWLWVDVISLCR